MKHLSFGLAIFIFLVAQSNLGFAQVVNPHRGVVNPLPEIQRQQQQLEWQRYQREVEYNNYLLRQQQIEMERQRQQQEIENLRRSNCNPYAWYPCP